MTEKITQTHSQDVRAAQNGDAQAFERLIKGSTQAVYAIALSISADPQTAPDIAQETFMLAWRDLGRLSNPEAWPGWIRQIARNQSLQHLRQRKRRPGDFAQAHLATTNDPSHTLDADHLLLQREKQAALQKAYARLPTDQRQVMALFYGEGLPISQIAQTLGLSEPAIKKRLSRARLRLQDDVVRQLGRPTIAAPILDPEILAALAASSQKATALKTTTTAATGLAAMLGPQLLMGTVGVAFGAWLQWRRTRDDTERKALLKLTAIALLAATAFPFALTLGGKLAMTASLWLFMATMAWIHLRRMPTVTAPRRALERLEDPRAPQKHRTHKALNLTGLILGLTLGQWAILISNRPW